MGLPMGWGSKQKATRKRRAGVFGEREEGWRRSAGRPRGAGILQPRSAADGPGAARVRA